MTSPLPPEVLVELKNLILDAADKSEPADSLHDDEVLFGPDSRLGRGSLDALQISMAIQKRYGVRMPDSKDTRRALSSLINPAEYLTLRRSEAKK